MYGFILCIIYTYIYIQYGNWELPDAQAGLRKGRRTRDQIANICCIMRKEENSREISTSASLTTLKPLTV